jgi:AcrR family transcriptional regulator
VQEVADRGGQSLRTFYQHFACKDDLILAVFEEASDQMIARVHEEVEKYSEPIERLAALIIGTAVVEEQDVSPLQVALTHVRLQLLQSKPSEVARIVAGYAALLREMIEAAVEAGQIPPCEPRDAAHFIAWLKISSYYEAFVMGEALHLTPPSQVEIARFCLRGLGADLPAAFAP